MNVHGHMHATVCLTNSFDCPEVNWGRYSDTHAICLVYCSRGLLQLFDVCNMPFGGGGPLSSPSCFFYISSSPAAFPALSGFFYSLSLSPPSPSLSPTLSLSPTPSLSPLMPSSHLCSPSAWKDALLGSSYFLSVFEMIIYDLLWCF